MRLFDEHTTLRVVIESALEGRLGQAEFDDRLNPSVGRVDLGCYAVFGGDASHPLAERWVENLSPPVEIVLPPDTGWRDLVDRLLGESCEDRPMRTFALHALDRANLEATAATALDGLRVEPVSVETARLFDEGLRPHALQVFDSPKALVEHGLGFVALTSDGRVAAQTSSYAISAKSVEIAIGTHPDFRRRGLARIVAAHMILECLRRGLRPEWSASNPVSKRLARSLGYRPDALCDILFYE